MPPRLERVTLNGPSRHAIRKGYILGGPGVTAASLRHEVAAAATGALLADEQTRGITVLCDLDHPRVLSLSTPFWNVHDRPARDDFFARLARAVQRLAQCAGERGLRLVGAGMDPFPAPAQESAPPLCADVHTVEVLAADEVERVYNLLRQFLPELLAVSGNSAVVGGQLQDDASHRMAVFAQSFLPRYLSQSSPELLSRLQRILRRRYGIGDLSHMDVNPLGGRPGALFNADGAAHADPGAPAGVELRFLDAQSSLSMTRAQLLLFQAIAMQGRAMARRGGRVFPVRDRALDQNKALAVKHGAGAVFRPDESFRASTGPAFAFWFHATRASQRSTTSLLSIVENYLAGPLRDLECEFAEMAPVVLGPELRRRSRQCVASYAELQRWLLMTQGPRFAEVYATALAHALGAPASDLLGDVNRKRHPELAGEVERAWTERLKPPPRHQGRVVRYDPRASSAALVRADDGTEYPAFSWDLEGNVQDWKGSPVSFETGERRGATAAVRVRVEPPRTYSGVVKRYLDDRGFGFIRGEEGEIFFRGTDFRDGPPRPGDRVTFQVSSDPRGAAAVNVRTTRVRGEVQFFHADKPFGFILSAGGERLFVHLREVEGGTRLAKGEAVTFQVEADAKGPRATRVRRADREEGR